MNLTKFKKEISKLLETGNDEDQWTYDYESYLYSLASGYYSTPTEWGSEYYIEDLKR
jgi:hypothetical protein